MLAERERDPLPVTRSRCGIDRLGAQAGALRAFASVPGHGRQRDQVSSLQPGVLLLPRERDAPKEPSPRRYEPTGIACRRTEVIERRPNLRVVTGLLEQSQSPLKQRVKGVRSRPRSVT
jgi:hypothetical protein